MKCSFIAIVLLVCWPPGPVNAQSISKGRLWVPTELKWRRIPGAPRGDRKRTAAAAVLYFGKDGAFVQDQCWLIRDGKSVSISNADPHNEYVGRITEPILDGMRIKYRLVHRTVEKAGEVLPGPEISDTASTMAASGVAIRRTFFRPAKLFNEVEYVEIYRTLARQYAQ